MVLGAAVLAGIIGTVVFTIILYIAPTMGMPKMDIIGMIGTMTVEPGGAAPVVGAVGHLIMGVVFPVIYALIWAAGVGTATWVWGLVFGLVHGLGVALVGMPLMASVHPRSPERESGPRALAGILIVHAAFGIVVAVSYAALA